MGIGARVGSVGPLVGVEGDGSRVGEGTLVGVGNLVRTGTGSVVGSGDSVGTGILVGVGSLVGGFVGVLGVGGVDILMLIIFRNRSACIACCKSTSV